MARNLRAKMPKENTLVVHDINQDVVERFVDECGKDDSGGKKGGGEEAEVGGPVESGQSVGELAGKCVSPR